MAQLDMALKIGFVLLATECVFASWMITIDWWAQAYRNGGVLDYGVAAYNTYASIHNTMSLVSNFDDALVDIIGALGDRVSSSSCTGDDNASALQVVVGFIIIGGVVLMLGILTTVMIIKTASASDRPSMSCVGAGASKESRMLLNP